MKYSLVMLGLFAGMGACSTDEIEVYKTGRYVYFTDMPTDSIKESFFFYPDARRGSKRDAKQNHHIKTPGSPPAFILL